MTNTPTFHLAAFKRRGRILKTPERVRLTPTMAVAADGRRWRLRDGMPLGRPEGKWLDAKRSAPLVRLAVAVARARWQADRRRRAQLGLRGLIAAIKGR